MTSVEYKVEKLPAPKVVLGESPHWDAHSQSLYFVNIAGGDVFRYDAKENKTYGAKMDFEEHVSFIIPVAETTDQFAVGLRRRVGVIQWDGKSPQAQLLRIAFEVEQSDEFKENVFNDGKADPIGRLYAGTLQAAEAKVFDDIFQKRTPGGFYRYAANEQVVKLRDNMQISNGLAWNVQKNKFYLIDSWDFNIKEFDYDPASGNVCKYLSRMLCPNLSEIQDYHYQFF